MIQKSPRAKSATAVHVFEAAGLGKAPFAYVGCSTGRMACEYCSTPIVNQFHVESADGKTFTVGCECIKKTDDRALMRPVAKALRTLTRQRQAAQQFAPSEIIRAQCADLIATHAEQLQRIPTRTAFNGHQPTLLDWSRLMLQIGVPGDLLARLRSALALPTPSN